MIRVAKLHARFVAVYYPQTHNITLGLYASEEKIERIVHHEELHRISMSFWEKRSENSWIRSANLI